MSEENSSEDKPAAKKAAKKTTAKKAAKKAAAKAAPAAPATADPATTAPVIPETKPEGTDSKPPEGAVDTPPDGAPPVIDGASPNPPPADDEKDKVADKKPAKKEKVLTLTGGARSFVAKHLQNWWPEESAKAKADDIVEAVENGELVYLLNEGSGPPALHIKYDLAYADRDTVKSLAAEHGSALVALFNQILAGRGFVAK